MTPREYNTRPQCNITIVENVAEITITDHLDDPTRVFCINKKYHANSSIDAIEEMLRRLSNRNFIIEIRTKEPTIHTSHNLSTFRKMVLISDNQSIGAINRTVTALVIKVSDRNSYQTTETISIPVSQIQEIKAYKKHLYPVKGRTPDHPVSVTVTPNQQHGDYDMVVKSIDWRLIGQFAEYFSDAEDHWDKGYAKTFQRVQVQGYIEHRNGEFVSTNPLGFSVGVALVGVNDPGRSIGFNTSDLFEKIYVSCYREGRGVINIRPLSKLAELADTASQQVAWNTGTESEETTD